MTLAPGRRDSLALLQVPEPSEDEGSVLVRALARAAAEALEAIGRWLTKSIPAT